MGTRPCIKISKGTHPSIPWFRFSTGGWADDDFICLFINSFIIRHIGPSHLINAIRSHKISVFLILICQMYSILLITKSYTRLSSWFGIHALVQILIISKMKLSSVLHSYPVPQGSVLGPNLFIIYTILLLSAPWCRAFWFDLIRSKNVKKTSTTYDTEYRQIFISYSRPKYTQYECYVCCDSSLEQGQSGHPDPMVLLWLIIEWGCSCSLTLKYGCLFCRHCTPRPWGCGHWKKSMG